MFARHAKVLGHIWMNERAKRGYGLSLNSSWDSSAAFLSSSEWDPGLLLAANSDRLSLCSWVCEVSLTCPLPGLRSQQHVGVFKVIQQSHWFHPWHGISAQDTKISVRVQRAAGLSVSESSGQTFIRQDDREKWKCFSEGRIKLNKEKAVRTRRHGVGTCQNGHWN